MGEMTDLPKVGQKYQHKKWGEVEVRLVSKRGRGHAVYLFRDLSPGHVAGEWVRLKDFQKATA